MRKKEAQKAEHVVSVRMTEELKDEVAGLVQSYPFLTQVDVIRLALQIGMRDMRDANLNLPQLFRTQAEANRTASAAAKHPKGKA